MQRVKNILQRYLLVGLIAMIGVGASSCSSDKETDQTEQSADIDVKEIILGHIQDSYEWHIVDIGERSITINLPIIVYSRAEGLNVFSSAKIMGGESYNGFRIATEGKYQGKIIESSGDQGEIRAWDFSITKNVVGLIVNSAIVIFIILYTARWYKKRDIHQVPKGFRGLIESVVDDIENGVSKPCIGEGYEKFTPYLLTAFFFILVNNLMGLVPIFPGGANVTGNIAVTLVLALCTFLIVNISGTKEYWKEIFWPNVPTWLKVPIPLMPVIELIGVLSKPFALTIRLFANITAGHAIILGLTCIIFITVSMGAAMNGVMTGVSILFSVFMLILKLLVSYIQAYVFTMLSAVFIGLSKVKPHAEVEKKI